MVPVAEAATASAEKTFGQEPAHACRPAFTKVAKAAEIGANAPTVVGEPRFTLHIVADIYQRLAASKVSQHSLRYLSPPGDTWTNASNSKLPFQF